MTRALITRPIEDARPLAEALTARGIEPVIEPLLTITALPAALPALEGVRALLFTSANGVRAFAAASQRRDLAVLAVGPTTAEAARAAGFATIDTADGDAEALARLVAERLKPADGRLVHVAGNTVAGDLAGQLRALGFAVERVALYDAVPADGLSPGVADDLGAGRIDWVLLFSPRTAATFARLVRNAGRADALKRCTAICLSPPVAEAVSSLPWHRIRIATKPDQENLLGLVENLQAEAAHETAAAATKLAKLATTRAPLWRMIAVSAVTSIVVICLLVGALIVSDRVSPWRGDEGIKFVPPSADDQRLAALEARVERLAGSATASPQTPSDSGVSERLAQIEGELNQRLAALSAELDTMRGKLSSVAQAESTSADKQSVSELDTRLTTLAERIAALQQRGAQSEQAQQQKNAEAARAAAFAVGVASLDSAARAGRPFAAGLTALRKLAPDAATGALLTPLETLAATGVATGEQLRRDWPEAARRAKAAQVASEYQGWVGRVMAFLVNAVTIRRVGADVTGDDTEALLARAETRLGRDDLAGAVAALTALPEPAATALKPWLERARARLAVETALSRLTEQALGAGARAGG